MNKRTFFRRAIAWLLIATMANPATMLPAMARDTDIFLSTTSGTTTAEPNIMIILDTSDSMNYFEDWHEYPGAYDSHVEYLWNDLNIIGNGGSPQNTESGSAIASGIGPTVSSITRSGTTATVTYASAHNYLAGWTLKVYNATDPLYNGTFTIATVPTSTTLTYTLSATPAANAVATGGFVLRASSRSPSPSSIYGFWGGATDAPEDRLAMWSAAKAYANGTESLGSGDPGVRSVWRNYNDSSWYYWTTASISSVRLRSPSLNRIRGHVGTIGGIRGGVNFGSTSNDYRGYNKCNDSGNAPAADGSGNSNALGYSSQLDPSDGVTPQGLTPSTIFSPSAAPRNSGRYLSGRWMRWERFLGLRYGRNSNGDTPYGTTFSTTNTSASSQNIASGSGTGSVGNSVTLRNDHAVDPNTLSGLKRDSWPNQPNYGGGTTHIGYQGQPIRTRIDTSTIGSVQAGDSYAGWTGVKADLGGFFASMITGSPWSGGFTANGSAAVTGATATSSYGVLAQMLDIYIDISGITTGTFSTSTSPANHALFKAWLGNRDSGASFGFETGSAAYYDHGYTKGNVTASSFAITITGNNGTSSFSAGNVVNITGAGVAGAYLTAQIASITSTTITLCSAGGGSCNIGSYPAPSSTVSNAEITPNIKLVTSGGGSTTVCTRTCTLSPATTVDSTDAGGSSRNWVPSSAVCNDSTGSSTNATATGTTGTDCSTPPAACGTPGTGSNYVTVAYSGCSWSGRQSLYVEGVGTYYYGGTCGAAATCKGIGNVTNGSPCPAASSPTTTFGSSSYVVSNRCSVSGLSNLTVNGTQMAGAVLGSSTNGCGNQNSSSSACPRPAAAGFAQPNGGAACIYGPSCNNRTVTQANSSTTADYAVFNIASYDTALTHDCTNDNNTNGNPSNGYLKNNTDTPFTTSWSANYNTAAASTAPYSSSGNAASASQMDVYSVNYLNWKFGPKGPNGAPIGRKTRLQVAKDALSSIVATTNGVRFGLMVFNRTAACLNASGSMSPGTAVFTATNPGFTVGAAISVVGAGTSGANLNTTISAMTPNASDPNQTDFTLAANAVNPSTTGSITNGGNTVTVGSTAGFAVGQLVKVVGADPSTTGDLVATVTSVLSGPARLVLSDTATATVAGAAVSIASFQTTLQTNPCSGAITNDGANVARVIKRMGSSSSDLPDYNNRATLIAAINAVTAAARTPLTESLYESYRYFSGRSPKWGTSTAVTSGAVSVTTGRDTTAICTTSGPGTGCSAVGAYASPMLNNPNTTNPAGCQKNFVVLITDGGPEDDYSANADVKSLSWAGPLGVVAPRTGLDSTQSDTTTNQFEVTTGVPYGPTDLAGTTFDGGYIWLDELAYFMSNADISPGARNFPGDSGSDSISGRQGVNTYTIGFAGANSPVLQNAAVKGNGVYYTAENSAALSAAIVAALAAITAWNPTVAAPTVPISALNRSENATDVYLAFFQPDPSSAWLGTVKKFQLSQYPNNGDASICGAGVGLCLIGQTSLTKSPPNPSPTYNIETVVVDAITGISQSQVDDNASSFWAPSSVTDGSRPNQGGTGYQLINNTSTLTPHTRKVYTFLTDSVTLQNGTSGSTVDLTNTANKVHFSNAGAISKCRLGDSAACGGTATMTDATQETLINWIRGGDTASTAACTDGTSSNCTTWRAWPHADVQHSKPAIVTYSPYVVYDPVTHITTPVPGTQVMFYLQNNGMLTAIDTATGIEKWSFLVEEALPLIQSQINDSAAAEIQIADGTPSIYIYDYDGNGTVDLVDRVVLFFGLRRGGRVMYAIDVTLQDTPQFMWKIDAHTAPAKVCTANGACSNAPQFNELGQTWSTPFVGKVRANTDPVLIFGGGYDPADDCQPVLTGPGPTGCTPAARSMGRAVFVIDAYDATIVQSWGVGQSGPFLGSGAASMIYAIPSDVTALNTDLDAQGFIDRVYVGDTWGNLWRFDTDSASVSNWNAKLLATLSSDISTGERRKILFPPAAVKQNAPFRFDAVYVGTGDREHPLCLVANQTTPTVMTNTCPVFAPADKFFMIIDPDYGLTATNTAPVTVADLYARTTSDLVTNTSNTILNTYKGWYRSLDNGEKVTNSPTVFNQRVRFGTYAPLGQSGGACVPPGEGRLNEIDATTGDLVPINGSVTQSSDRYYSTFITHGYISTGQLIVQGRNIYHIVVSDSRLQSVLVGSMGSATKIYWYMEPEQ